jgi:MoaA/NifB/PqqE/SkfB family radical SAM enzyme
MRSDLKESPASNVEEEDGEDRNGRLPSLPILLLNVHESCNCRCLMCDIWQRNDGKELNLADFARHRESLFRLGVRRVVLTGGEPLLHRNFESLCGFLAECGVHVTLLTTGLLLSKHSVAVADGVDEIIVSLDGPEEVHDQVRRVKGAYRLILEGIQAVKNKKAEMPFYGRSTVQKANHSLLRQTVAASKALSLDSISFLAADVTSQAFNRELIWPGERQKQIVLTRQEVEVLEKEIEDLIRENADDIRSRYILESEAKLNRIARRFREHLGGLTPTAPACSAPWVSAVMEVNGDVRPCFFHGSVGNTQVKTLEEVINGREALKFRSALKVADNAICQRCVCSLNYDPGPPANLEPAQKHSSIIHSHTEIA